MPRTLLKPWRTAIRHRVKSRRSMPPAKSLGSFSPRMAFRSRPKQTRPMGKPFMQPSRKPARIETCPILLMGHRDTVFPHGEAGRSDLAGSASPRLPGRARRRQKYRPHSMFPRIEIRGTPAEPRSGSRFRLNADNDRYARVAVFLLDDEETADTSGASVLLSERL